MILLTFVYRSNNHFFKVASSSDATFCFCLAALSPLLWFPNMAHEQSKQQPSRNLDESPPASCSFASQELNPETWSRWIRCVYTPGLTATEFLDHWNQAYNCTQADLMALDTEIPKIVQYWQFLEAVRSHPDLEQWYPNADWESKEAISMHQVRSQFLEIAINIPARKQIVALVARSSSGSRMEKDDYLLWSLVGLSFSMRGITAK